jgi:CDP-diacylglycerol--serine O-phosphatidyltransferase
MKLFTIPNLITLCNLVCGILSCVLTIKGIHTELILYLLIASLLFDFLDGLVARILKQSSEIGGELDSLADVISFGLLPGLLIFNLFNGNQTINDLIHLNLNFSFLPFLAFLIPLFSALRLAKFNIDKEQTYYFKGLNTPTSTIFIFSLYYLFYNKNWEVVSNQWFLILVIFSICYLLISDIPMMSLKFKGLSWQTNQTIYLFLLICLTLVLLFGVSSVPFLVIFYILYSTILKNKIISS